MRKNECITAHVADLPSPSPQPNDGTADLGGAADFEENTASSDNDGSEDADFDMEEDGLTPQSEGAAPLADNSSSQGSRRGSKRKAAIEEDEYIKANPELYGLRRSVRNQAGCPAGTAC